MSGVEQKADQSGRKIGDRLGDILERYERGRQARVLRAIRSLASDEITSPTASDIIDEDLSLRHPDTRFPWLYRMSDGAANYTLSQLVRGGILRRDFLGEQGTSTFRRTNQATNRLDTDQGDHEDH